ncbi:MAG: hypothetical protein ACRCVS_05030, partial [Fusobacteriaceae bacterium]
FMKLAQSNQLIENGDFSEKHLKTFKINLIKIEEILQKKYDLLELSKKLISLMILKNDFKIMTDEITPKIENYKKLHVETKKQQIKKVLAFDEIEKELLMSKNGRILVGGALNLRLRKLAKDMKVEIKYNDFIFCP